MGGLISPSFHLIIISLQSLQIYIKDIYINNIGVKTMQKNLYSGWYNYETWNYKLWLDNDEKSYFNLQEIIKAVFDTEEEQNLISKLAKILEELCYSNCPDLEASCYSDMLNASIREINFYQIAEAYIKDNRNELTPMYPKYTQKQVDEEIKRVKGLFKQAQKIVKSSQA